MTTWRRVLALVGIRDMVFAAGFLCLLWGLYQVAAPLAPITAGLVLMYLSLHGLLRRG